MCTYDIGGVRKESPEWLLRSEFVITHSSSLSAERIRTSLSGEVTDTTVVFA